ncbi:MAG: glutamate ligase domain-containing protein [Candidatus Limnocylindrales bacterium]
MTRSAEEIGRGLAEPRPARPIAAGERIHIVGAAGAGASAAMLLAHHARAGVTGCDPGGSSAYTQLAEQIGLTLSWRHDPRHVVHEGHVVVDRLGVTKALTSVAPDHPELRAARDHGVPLEPWQQVVADAAATQGGRLVGVAGTHGKSTSAGWLVDLLVRADRDPAAYIGALRRDDIKPGGSDAATSLPSTARWGRGDVFVVEADEYAGNFDAFRPSLAILLNAEWDHPDVFADEEAVLASFERWIRASDGAGERPTLVANVGNAGVATVVERLSDWPGRIVRTQLNKAASGSQGAEVTGRLEGAPVDAPAAGPTHLELRMPGAAPSRLSLPLPGRHNAENALCVAAAAWSLAVPAEAIAAHLVDFRGVGRRLELKGDVGGVVVIDDYGHHPTAIGLTLEAVRGGYPGRRVWAVYEPLTYHRTAAMLPAFADVLSTADAVAVADIWAGRDPDTTIASAAGLAAAVNQRGRAHAEASGSVEETADYLAAEVRPGDVVLVMGGGRSYVIADRLVDRLGGRESTTTAGPPTLSR